MPQGVLDRDTLSSLITGDPPLVSCAVDLATQLQPNGIDLTAREVSRYAGAGATGFSNSGRVLAPTESMPFGAGGKVSLAPGAYLVTFNEVVTLPRDLTALGRTRSSLLRCGVALHTAVWDAGYSGRSQSLMVVYNPHGFTLERDARIMQLVFFRLEQRASQGYAGIFQGERG